MPLPWHTRNQGHHSHRSIFAEQTAATWRTIAVRNAGALLKLRTAAARPNGYARQGGVADGLYVDAIEGYDWGLAFGRTVGDLPVPSYLQRRSAALPTLVGLPLVAGADARTSCRLRRRNQERRVYRLLGEAGLIMVAVSAIVYGPQACWPGPT